MKATYLLVVALLIAQSRQGLDHCKTRGALTNGSEICLECEAAHYLNATRSMTECPDCVHGCALCSYIATTDNYTCTACKESHRFDPQDPKRCIDCPEDCKVCDKDGKCTLCEDDGEILSDGTCKEKKNKFWIWFFVIFGAIFALLVGLFIYNKYWGQGGNADAEGEAYKQAESLNPIKNDEQKKKGKAQRNMDDSD